jgi:hypothetical protein
MLDKREQLLKVAHRYAVERAREPGVVGVLLYGSLASPDGAAELTPLSDVDVAVILDDALPVPAHFTEHRMRDGVKVDALVFPLATICALAEDPPERLWGRGWLLQFVLRTLLLAGEDALLYDPTGALSAVRRDLRARTGYEALATADAVRWLQDYEENGLAAARAALAAGEWEAARERAGWAVDALGHIPPMLAGRKQMERAAALLGMDGFVEATAALRDLLSPTPGDLAAYRDAGQTLWRQVQAQFFEPVADDLRCRAGVADPGRVELPGDRPLFWPGNRVHEFGRVVGDCDLTFTWSRFAEESGNRLSAFRFLWPAEPERVTARCRAVADALWEQGFDARGRIDALFTDGEYRRLCAEAEDAKALAVPLPATAENAARAVELGEQMRRSLADALAARGRT